MKRLSQWIAGAVAVTALFAVLEAAKQAPPKAIDTKRMKLSFEETFGSNPSFYDPTTKQGRWKTNYWFGWQEGSSSRTFASEKEIMVDTHYVGLNPFSSLGKSFVINSDKNPIPDAPLLEHKAYTGGIITTEKSFSQKYGYFEARISMPANAGFWPSFWLWSKPGDKSLGNEIDVVETQTVSQDKSWHSLHLRAKPGPDGSPVKVPDVPDSTEVKTEAISRPHVYGLLWTKQDINWYVDGKQVLHRANPGFHDPMFIILTNGVGGWEPGNDHPTSFPGQMKIDYVRAYLLPGQAR